MLEKNLSIPEFAETLGVGLTTANELVWSGEVDSIKIGNRRLVPPQCAEAYIQRKLKEQRPHRS